MALIKYFVYVGDEVVALRINERTDECIVAGFTRNREIMSAVVRYFVMDVPEFKNTQMNKGRFNFTCTMEKFMRGLEDLRKQSFVLQKVQRHGRCIA